MSTLGKFVLGLVVVGTLVVLVTLLRPANQESDARFSIVTTFSPLTALTKPIVGNVARLSQLVPSGQSAHEYQTTPQNLTTLKRADLLVLNGLDLEGEWLGPLLESTAEPVPAVLNLGQELKNRGTVLLDATPEETDRETHPIGLGTDPHLWVSPKNAIKMVEAIRDELVRLDPAHATTYQANATAFLTELASLDQTIQDRVATFSQTGFIAFHNAFSYYARDYGLTQLAAIELTPGESPTPGQLSVIRSLVAEHALRGLFTEPQFSSDVVDQLAADLGILVRELDPIETSEADASYVAIHERNLAALADVLQ
ncbi:zinc ABC transporter substrate-binding protein [Candidatus Berkelbacteria bacterium]|nr:zinc ABC transporter substrate-binding protein [Candidatus Berkelbacteria bacterium]